MFHLSSHKIDNSSVEPPVVLLPTPGVAPSDSRSVVGQHKRLLVVGAVGVVLVVITVVIIASVMSRNSSNDSTASSQSAFDDLGEAVTDDDSVYAQAEAAMTQGGLDSFMLLYNTQIATAATDTDRAQLLLDRAQQLAGYYIEQDTEDEASADSAYIEQALADALEAERLHPSYISASQLASIYFVMENDAEGDRYYQLSIEREAAELAK